MNADNTLLPPPDACAHLLREHGIRRTPGTLAKLRCAGTGPRFVRINKSVFYRPAALADYARYLTSPAMKSTHDLAEAAA